jgi:hypothetical protein
MECHLMFCGSLSLRTEPYREPQASENDEPNQRINPRFDSIRFGSVRFGSVRFGSVRFGSIRLDSNSSTLNRLECDFEVYIND